MDLSQGVVDEAELLEYGRKYSYIHFPDRQENTVPMSHLLRSDQVTKSISMPSEINGTLTATVDQQLSARTVHE